MGIRRGGRQKRSGVRARRVRRGAARGRDSERGIRRGGRSRRGRAGASRVWANRRTRGLGDCRVDYVFVRVGSGDGGAVLPWVRVARVRPRRGKRRGVHRVNRGVVRGGSFQSEGRGESLRGGVRFRRRRRRLGFIVEEDECVGCVGCERDDGFHGGGARGADGGARDVQRGRPPRGCPPRMTRRTRGWRSSGSFILVLF